MCSSKQFKRIEFIGNRNRVSVENGEKFGSITFESSAFQQITYNCGDTEWMTRVHWKIAQKVQSPMRVDQYKVMQSDRAVGRSTFILRSERPEDCVRFVHLTRTYCSSSSFALDEGFSLKKHINL